MMMEEECDCAHEQAGQRRLDSLRPTGASTCVVRVQALSLVAVRNNPSPSHHKQKNLNQSFKRVGAKRQHTRGVSTGGERGEIQKFRCSCQFGTHMK